MWEQSTWHMWHNCQLGSMMLVMANKMYVQPSHAEVARRAECDPRTVAAFLAGAPVRPLAAARISRAITELAADLESRDPPRALSLCSMPGMRA